jgi:hypothetical protein
MKLTEEQLIGSLEDAFASLDEQDWETIARLGGTIEVIVNQHFLVSEAREYVNRYEMPKITIGFPLAIQLDKVHLRLLIDRNAVLSSESDLEDSQQRFLSNLATFVRQAVSVESALAQIELRRELLPGHVFVASRSVLATYLRQLEMSKSMAAQVLHKASVY